MTDKNKRLAKKIAKTGAWAAGDIAALALKIFCTVVLTVLTTGAIFACFFMIYVRTNLTSGLEVNPEDFQLNLSSVIYAVDPETGRERELVTLQSLEFRIWVDFEDIPEHMIDALVSIEDHRYFNHSGVDWYRTSGAFLNMFLSMRDTFGGSTITQQVIKNLTHDDDTTVQRKLTEIFRAIEFERQFDKEDILELYLNIVYFGHGRFGVGAAAEYYFGKEVSELTLAESASIIGITNNPSRFSPYANREANKERQETILFRMNDLGYINNQEYRRALDQSLNFRRGEHSMREEVVYTWFEEAIIRDVTRDLMNEFGLSEQEARRRLFTHGLRIVSTIDLEMQEIVDNMYQNPDSLPRVTGSAQPLQSGIIIADPYTGEVKALSGGVGNKNRNMILNRATSTRRPPGSAIKPISVYAPAMENGLLTPNTLYDDRAGATLSGTTWMPRNSDRTHRGIVDARTALRLSLNTVPAMIIDEMSPSVSFRFMRDALGFDLSASDEAYAPLAAGQLTYGATVREMASAFTMFANGGQRVELRTYTRIYSNDGSILLDNTPRYTRAISERTAFWMTDMLLDAVTAGTGGAANLGAAMPTAGKTGTSTDSKDRWFVGFTPYYVAAVWTGFDRPARMSSNGNPAAQIFRQIMSQVHEGLERGEFNRPDDVTLPPVLGIDRADYIIRSVDVDGETLQEERVSAIVGREIIVTAPHLDGYILISELERTIIVTNDSARNVARFIYEPEEPEDTEDPEGPESPEDPEYPEYPDETGDPYTPPLEPPDIFEPPPADDPPEAPEH